MRVEHGSIARNFFPVTSCIAIRDEKKEQQMTVMVERTVAGSSLVDGRVELIQYRRMSKMNDGKGITESYNEMDKHGRGLQVEGKYWLAFENY